MYQPASLKGESPVPIDERVRNRWLILYILIIILSFVPCSLFEYWYVSYLWNEASVWLFFLLLPFNLFLVIHLLQLSALITATLILNMVNLIHAPREGIFKRTTEDRDYLFWNIRNVVKKWPLYITSSNPFPWWKNRFALRFFGVRIGSKTICDNSWISSEFVSIGKNVIIGMNSSVLSFGIEQDNLILKKVRVESDVLIGAKCVLLPGTLIKRNVKLSAHSYTNHNAVLEEDSIYIGHPAKIKREK